MNLDCELIVRWVIGYGFALGGSRAIGPVIHRLRMYLGNGNWPPKNTKKEIPPWVVGLIEGVFFTTAVAFEMSGVTVAMIAWIAAKMAANWGARKFEGIDNIQAFRLSALLGSLASMGFALIGGLICRGTIWL